MSEREKMALEIAAAIRQAGKDIAAPLWWVNFTATVWIFVWVYHHG